MLSNDSVIKLWQRRRTFFKITLKSPDWLESLGSPMGHTAHLALLLGAIGFWFMWRSYIGIRHDSILYFGQAMLQLMPESFKEDIFFKYGSQDQYTIFSNLMAWAMRHFGMTAWLMPALLVCQFSFLATVYLVLRRMTSVTLAAAGIMFLAVVPYYGGFLLFSYGEAFLTARSVAEPLVLLAIWLIMRERLAISVVPLALATLVHPLMAVIGWGVLAILVLQSRPRLSWIILAIPLVIAILLAAGVDLSRFTDRYDDAWWEVMIPRNTIIAIEQWPIGDWSRVVFDITVLWLAGRLAPPAGGRVLLAILLVFAASLAFAGFVGDIFRLALFSQAQVWRTQWLAHLLAAGLFPWTIWMLRDRGAVLWLGAALLLSGLGFYLYHYSLASVCMGAVATFLAYNRVRVKTRSFSAFCCLVALAILTAGALNDFSIATYLGYMHDEGNTKYLISQFFALTFIASVMIASVVFLAVKTPRLAVVAMGALVLLSASMWDDRGPWLKYIETHMDEPHPFDAYIPVGSQVYWPGDFRAEWMLLKRPNYFSEEQASGLLFSRGTALEFSRREDVLAQLVYQSEICSKLELLGSPCHVTPDAIESACDIDNGPDFIILGASIEGKEISSWKKKFENGVTVERFLYSCKTYRTAAESPSKTLPKP